MQLIKGSVSAIPAELLSRHDRATYEWDKLGIGDVAVFDNEPDFPKIRTASTSYGRGTKKRGPRAFATRVVDAVDEKTKAVILKEDGTPKRLLEVWRLPDPSAIPATPEAEVTAKANGKAK